MSSSEKDREGVAVICMPLLLNVPYGRSDWYSSTCPACGAKCWRDPVTDHLVKHGMVRAICTFCALREGATC